jgi:hypothetical protein
MDSVPGFFFGRCGIKKHFPLCFVVGCPGNKDRARIDFISDDWVKKQIDAGKLSLQFLPLSGQRTEKN